MKGMGVSLLGENGLAQIIFEVEGSHMRELKRTNG